MKRFYFYAALILGLINWSCSSEKNQNMNQSAVKISAGKKAEGSYLTNDTKGNPVIVWTQEDSSGVYVYYAVSENGGKTFGQAKRVVTSKGTRFHGESMNKVIFKPDGTVIAVYEKRFPTESNRFAGAIFYTQSFDNGNSWTEPSYLHTDTSSGIGRSFFDVAVLPTGEIGAVWLDGRHQLKEKGSSLFFSSTNGKNGFVKDVQIGETVCQCCRTGLYTDLKGNLHVIYRDILNDSIRDMVHLISLDSGKTFSQPERISADNWVINGCPHTGPDMVQNKNGFHYTWYTAGGEAGVYYCSSNDSKSFSKRELVSKDARHPRIESLNDEVILVWDEMIKKDTSFYPGIALQRRDGNENKILHLSEADKRAYFPQVLKVDDQNILVSWTQEENDQTSVFYKLVEVK